MFQYSIQDQSGAISNTGNVNIFVDIPNNPPVAYDMSGSVNEDNTLMDSLS
jgi:hypothetical protein